MYEFRISPKKKPCTVCGVATKYRKGTTPLHPECDKK